MKPSFHPQRRKPMDDKIIAIFCLCDDLLKAMHHQEDCQTPGGFGDVDALKYYAYALPDGSIIYADKAYNDYEIEDFLQEVEHITLLPMRKKNSKRALPPEVSFVQHYYRKMVE